MSLLLLLLLRAACYLQLRGDDALLATRQKLVQTAAACIASRRSGL
jgi:hypothetical protein